MNFYDHPSSGHADAPANTASPPPPNTSATTEEQFASRLFDSMHEPEEQKADAPPKPEGKDDTDFARSLYGESMYADATLVTRESHPDLTEEQATQVNAAARVEFHKLELSPGDARSLMTSFATGMRLSDADYERKAAGFKEQLTRRFGAEADERLGDVRKLLAKADPAVVTAFVESGLNIDIETVVVLANHARSLKARGRL